MTDLLRRKQAPLAPESWKLIDDQAREVLTANLSARRFVDVSGPHGWQFAAVNVGRLDPGRADAGEGVFFGIRKVLPLVEVRVPFQLDLWPLDDAVRGARDPNLDPVVQAALKIARFEERAIYYGFQPSGIVGLAQAATHTPVPLPREGARLPETVARAMVMLERSGEPPPYVLVAGPTLFQSLESTAGGYPARKQIESLIRGEVRLAPFVDGGFLVPAKGDGDFELVLGQDFSVGFEAQEGAIVRLYLTESFTFRVLEPQAIVTFRVER